MPRLFFALWPDTPARRELAGLAVRVAQGARGRPVPAEKLHLTLAFLGKVDPGRVEAARRAAGRVDAPSFRIRLDRLGGFAGSEVGWAGCSEVPAALLYLQARLHEALVGEGFAIEKRSFTPHLTLARGIALPVQAVMAVPVTWRVTAFALVESLPREGSYATRAEWPVGVQKN